MIEKDEVIEKSWSELEVFAKDNKKQITQVSQILLKYKDKISLDKTPLDYETLIMDEDETVKEDFRRVFKTVSFSYETITNKQDSIVYYFYNYEDGTSYGIVYFDKDGKDKQDTLSFMKNFGEVIQITDSIYAYYYRLNHT
ncbi:hypothetical protein [Mobilisporobacter senegalensis]|nr:hypothetical protein [Mobilisporobacter senegalensis]